MPSTVRPNDGQKPTVSVIIPTLNEELNLPHVAERMPMAWIDEIVVVDGNSTDNTCQVAQSLFPDSLVITQTRRGKGNALACGILAATKDIIVMIDADGSTDPAEIPRFVQALIDGADFAKGSRFVSGGGSDDITRFRRIGNRGLNGIVNGLFGSSFTDLCYGYNAFWRHCISTMDLPTTTDPVSQWGDGFEIETLINVRIAKSELTIAEVPSHEQPRIHGASNLNAFRDGFRVLRTILDERADRAEAAGSPVLANPAPGSQP